MGSVNIADSVLEDRTCEDGDPDSDLEWDKSNESFTDFFERVLRKAEEDNQISEEELEEIQGLSENDLDLIEGRVDAIMQEYAR